MRKLVCCILVCVLAFASVGALAADLQQIWESCGLFVMNPGGRTREDTSGERRIDGQPIGENADWFLDGIGVSSGGSCEDLIEACQADYAEIVPLLHRLATEASGLEAELIESELYIKADENGEDRVWEEYYLIYAAGNLPEGFKEYELIIKVSSEMEGGTSAGYYLLAEDNAYPMETDTSEFDQYLGDLRIINCNEWVSLRAAPNVNAPRVAKVPLGAYVNGATYINGNQFVYCSYNGQCGYVLLEYLDV